MRTKIWILLTVLILITVTACSNPKAPAANEKHEKQEKHVKQEKDEKQEKDKYIKGLTYSNLVDNASQNELKEALESAGVSIESIASFIKTINHYNRTIGETSLVKEGFTTIDSLEPSYDLSGILEKWEQEYPTYIGNNCRITSFSIMNNFISIDNPDGSDDSNLFMDLDALETSPEKLFDHAEEERFKSLFSSIPTENTKDISIHLKKVQEDWKSKGISFLNQDKISLVSVFFHSDLDSSLFIGHAGILLKAKDGKLMFIEKLNFQEPYQALKFNNRQELNDYLMNKYDLSWDQPFAKPFIMENDQLIEGYRENPNNKERSAK